MITSMLSRHRVRLRSILHVANGGIVNSLKSNIILVGRIFLFKFETRLAAHDLHLIRMVPGPLDLFCEIVRVPRGKMQAGVAIVNYFLHRSQARAYDRHTTREALRESNWKVFIPFA